ncbi:MAG: DUF302 domain-containing protein [Acidobacteria bacterium]|nr:DUF302 domain-containing protein [Acidobacteriota bacterium]
MKLNQSLSKLTLGVALAAASFIATPASASENAFQGGRVAVESGKSFDDVTKAVKNLVAKNGMMVMAEVDQGKMLSMTGLQLKATLFLIGNPNVGKQLFEQDHAVGLYVPLRLSVYSDANGKTFVEYDKPSTVLGQFQNEKIGMVAKMLDEKIGGLAQMAAQ